MILLVGSLAAQFHIEGFRKAKDIDLIATMSDMMDFVEEHELKVAPVSKTKFTGMWADERVQIEIAGPCSAAEMLLDIVTGSVIDFMGQKVFLPELDWLYALKLSHRHVRSAPDFRKTMDDLNIMGGAFKNPPQPDTEWIRLREQEAAL